MTLLRYAAAAIAVVALAAVGEVWLLSPPAELWRPLFARAPALDPPTVPCSKQGWPNADRICLTWTAPRETAGAVSVGGQHVRMGGAGAGDRP